PITVTGLANGTAYTFSATATNSVGASSASSASSSVIPLTVPGAPTAVSGVSGNTQAVVSFTAPTSNGGATITSYTVTATPPDGGAAVTAAGSASPITVTGLTNGTTYTFSATATNSVGTSSASSASSSVIPVTVPGAPTAVSGVSVNTRTVVQTNYLSANRIFSGVQAVSNADLLQTNLASVSRTGASYSGNRYFLAENPRNPADLSRLTNGSFGELGGSSNDYVLPNQVTLTFVLKLGSTITSIRTFAGWRDTGRDGQAYTVQYSVVSDPTNFITLAAITRYNPDESNFPIINNDGQTNPNTMVELTSSSGPLAVNVAAIRFVFGNYDTNTNAFENGGTGYREIDVIGSTGATTVIAGNSQATLTFTAPSDNGGAS
ncbi:MAG: fibronectin type III domain-containing protein, partial [Opitutaceae bacterium]|nr:fibronectin type III domain-containing protein [Opitutaceae bacterium]